VPTARKRGRVEFRRALAAVPFPFAAAVLLGAAAGMADAIGYVQGGVFAANMTGNTVLAALALATAHRQPALQRIATLATFFAGAVGDRVAAARRLRPCCCATSPRRWCCPRSRRWWSPRCIRARRKLAPRIRTPGACCGD